MNPCKPICDCFRIVGTKNKHINCKCECHPYNQKLTSHLLDEISLNQLRVGDKK